MQSCRRDILIREAAVIWSSLDMWNTQNCSVVKHVDYKLLLIVFAISLNIFSIHVTKLLLIMEGNIYKYQWFSLSIRLQKGCRIILCLDNIILVIQAPSKPLHNNKIIITVVVLFVVWRYQVIWRGSIIIRLHFKKIKPLVQYTNKQILKQALELHLLTVGTLSWWRH